MFQEDILTPRQEQLDLMEQEIKDYLLEERIEEISNWDE